MIENTIKVKDNKSGKIYDAFTQGVELNFDGKYYTRWNIGINGYNEWTCICCVYSDAEFNETYTVVKWDKEKKQYI